MHGERSSARDAEDRYGAEKKMGRREAVREAKRGGGSVSAASPCPQRLEPV